MSTSPDSSPSESTYFIDAENAAEMARLTNQARLITRGTGGLLSELSAPANMRNILDVACGPGGWVLDVAQAHPGVQVVGVDISTLMIKYAHAQALTRGLENASFTVMDALKPLAFPENSFDLVNARLIAGFMLKAVWPTFIQECLRITRPGGIIRLTECEFGMGGITNSPAYEKLFDMGTRAMKSAGFSFSPDGRNVGITPVLGCLLRDAGYQNIQQKAYVLDYSAGTESHGDWYQIFMVFWKLFQPFLIKMGVTTQEEVDVLYHRALMEMQTDSFCGIWFFLTVWGQKPERD